jgi:glycosyltransferase involved in cell wall biosynthesis
MRIAFIGARGVPHGYSSAEQMALHVGRRLVQRGHEFTVYCRRNLFRDRSPTYQGITRVFLPTIEHKLLGQVIHGTLAGLHAASRRFDVVHVQCLTNVFQAVVPWLGGRNVVINVNGQEWDNPKWPRPLRHVFFRSAARAAMLMCREIVTDARGMHDLYVERYGRRSTVIEYGAEVVESRNPAVLATYGLEPRGYWLVAARLVPSNQLRSVVDAFTAAGVGRALAIAGGGDYGSAYYRDLRAAAGPNVRFLGLISDQAHMDELYANAYAYLHGAAWGGINSALLRPLGAGCPALAADSPFNREVLEREDGLRCGLLWRDAKELCSAIRRWDGEADLVESLRAVCRRQIRENFTWDLVADQYEVFYRGFVERWPVKRIRAEVAAQREKYRT